ncbi:MAG TPA: hypothetical protein VE547_16920 [Mycobacteriales bacterium]|nr:hypothetical protein [Mycobacteriales bacterium]
MTAAAAAAQPELGALVGWMLSGIGALGSVGVGLPAARRRRQGRDPVTGEPPQTRTATEG